MHLLVDTHVLLRAMAQPDRLPAAARTMLESPENEVSFSAASIWEIAIKMQIGRLDLPLAPEELAQAAVRMGFEELPIRAAHAARVRTLPPYHRDPFDRLLVAQALHHPARLLTADRVLARYSELVEVIG